MMFLCYYFEIFSGILHATDQCFHRILPVDILREERRYQDIHGAYYIINSFSIFINIK